MLMEIQNAASETHTWPPQVNMILSAMETVPHAKSDARAYARLSYRVRGELKLFADMDGSPLEIYTRDIDARGVGFITPHRLPLGYGGTLTLTSPQGDAAQINCTLYRCCPVLQGWYEGALYFNREQWMFAV